jgi:hypothetical protein
MTCRHVHAGYVVQTLAELFGWTYFAHHLSNDMLKDSFASASAATNILTYLDEFTTINSEMISKLKGPINHRLLPVQSTPPFVV